MNGQKQFMDHRQDSPDYDHEEITTITWLRLWKTDSEDYDKNKFDATKKVDAEEKEDDKTLSAADRKNYVLSINNIIGGKNINNTSNKLKSISRIYTEVLNEIIWKPNNELTYWCPKCSATKFTRILDIEKYSITKLLSNQFFFSKIKKQS